MYNVTNSKNISIICCLDFITLNFFSVVFSYLVRLNYSDFIDLNKIFDKIASCTAHLHLTQTFRKTEITKKNIINFCQKLGSIGVKKR